MEFRDLIRQGPLGHPARHADAYAPGLLFAVPRKAKREEIGLGEGLPFHGCDIWNAYEVSWLNSMGKPEVAVGEFRFPCISENIVESKSLKLYLNSFNGTRFRDREEVQAVLVGDLSAIAGAEVGVSLVPADRFPEQRLGAFSGLCLDDLDVSVGRYTVFPDFLACRERVVHEQVYSNLLRSNCPVTGQPDWGSVWFHYAGRQVDHEGLLRYVISFRDHQAFHEHCVERMFADILERCGPEKLTVYARYTRRGGLDINPFRSNFEDAPENVRLVRQ